MKFLVSVRVSVSAFRFVGFISRLVKRKHRHAKVYCREKALWIVISLKRLLILFVNVDALIIMIAEQNITMISFLSTCFSIGDIYPGCLVSATPLTVLYRSFWNFVCVFFMARRCACGLDIIVRLIIFCHFFHIVNLESFFTSIYRQWVPLVSATPLTVLYWLFWNFACVFFMVWGCACGLGIIVKTFFVTFSTLWT